MRVLISTDIEGVAGVFDVEQTRAGNPEYERARRLMAQEASAAVAGAFAAGATDVLVNDSHGHFRNMPAELIDARAQLIQGKPRRLGMMAGVDDGVAAVCLVGYHSRAQGRGILAHTINSFAFARVFINQRELGEAGIYGALAGSFGVPVAMAAGDDVFIDEHLPLLPDTLFVQTKRATGHASGISLSPEASCAAIRGGVAKALAGPLPAPFVIAPPISVRIVTTTPAIADLFSILPTVARVAGDEIAFDTPTMEAALRTINSLSAMSAALR